MSPEVTKPKITSEAKLRTTEDQVSDTRTVVALPQRPLGTHYEIRIAIAVDVSGRLQT